MKKINMEKLIAGIVALVTFSAIICEVIFGGVSVASIASAIKDIAGIVVDIAVFFIAFKTFVKKENIDFRSAFESEMERVERNYAPLIFKFVPKETEKQSIIDKNKKVIRYDMLENVENLFTSSGTGHFRIFELDADKPRSITFFVREKFFGSQYDSNKISSDIDLHLSKKYKEYTVEHGNDNICIQFNKELSTIDDAKEVVSLIDTTIMLFIAKNKK